jgi:hypothetical protein
VVLFGAWRQEKENVFRAAEKVPFQDPRVRTITVTLTGDQARAEQLFKQVNMKSLLSLME